MEKERSHYKFSDMKTLGWTDKLIKDYLGDPDEFQENPVYKNQAPMRLYLIERVNQIISDNDLEITLQSNLEKRNKRSKSGRKSANTKRQKVLDWIDSLEISIPQYEYQRLVEWACNHYNDREFSRALQQGHIPDFREAHAGSDSHFLYRIIHNYLRHVMTDYDAQLKTLFGKVGKQEGRDKLKEKITTEIDKAYPDLKKIKPSAQMTWNPCIGIWR